METNSQPNNKPSIKNKTILTLVGLAILIIAGGVFYAVKYKQKLSKPSQNSQKTLISAYPPGTKIENPKAVPADFPKQLLLENLPLTHIDSVNYPNGREDITLAYNSTKQLADEMALYAGNLKTQKWDIKTNELSKDKTTGVILAKDAQGHTLIVTVIAAKTGSRVTLLYQK